MAYKYLCMLIAAKVEIASGKTKSRMVRSFAAHDSPWARAMRSSATVAVASKADKQNGSSIKNINHA